MAKTLLQIIQAATGELQLDVPSAVSGNTNRTTVQAKALVIAACDELADEYNWQRLIKTHTFTTQEGVSCYNLPSDFLRQVPTTSWDRTNQFRLRGSVSPQSWEFLRSGTSYTGPYSRYRIAGNKLEVTPTPGVTPVSFVFQYITSNYVIDATLGTLKAEFTQDSDKTVFHDRLLINLVKLKLWEIKGFDTTTLTYDFNNSLAAAKGSDTPAQVLNMGRGSDVHPMNVPDGNWEV